MIRDHVPERARRLVIAATPLDPHGLRRGDLHVVYITSIPNRFENAVAETEHQQVLHRLLAEIVIDAVNLALAEHLLDLGIQRVRRFEVAPKRLLDDDAPPGSLGLAHQTD